MDIAAIRNGLEAVGATIAGLHSYGNEPEQLESPAVVFMPAEPFVDYHLAMNRGLAELNFDAIVLVSTGSGYDRAFAAVDTLLSSGTTVTGSLVDALESTTNQTLGGLVDHVVVNKAEGLGLLDIKGGGAYATGRLSVTVRTSRT